MDAPINVTPNSFWAFDYTRCRAILVTGSDPETDQPDTAGFVSWWVPVTGRRMIAGLSLFPPNAAGLAAALAHVVSSMMQPCWPNTPGMDSTEFQVAIRQLFAVAGPGWDMYHREICPQDGTCSPSLPVCKACRAVIMPEHEADAVRETTPGGWPILHGWCKGLDEGQAWRVVHDARAVEWRSFRVHQALRAADV